MCERFAFGYCAMFLLFKENRSLNHTLKKKCRKSSGIFMLFATSVRSFRNLGSAITVITAPVVFNTGFNYLQVIIIQYLFECTVCSAAIVCSL